MPAEIVFNEETMRFIGLFQDMTKTTVLDCLDGDDKLVFVVKNGEIGKAVGKKGENIARLKRMLNKEVQVVEFSENPEEFVKNVFRNYDVRRVEIEERGDVVHATVTVDPGKKGRAIGKEGRNLRLARNLIARHHNIQSVSVA
jgi:N utilization substance protein A